MRAERLLEVIALLQAHGQLTAGEIAGRDAALAKMGELVAGFDYIVQMNAPGVITVSGDTATGACQDRDLLWQFVKGCAQAGVVPREATDSTAWIPVQESRDTFARADGNGEHDRAQKLPALRQKSGPDFLGTPPEQDPEHGHLPKVRA